MVRPHRIFAALCDRQLRPLERGRLGRRRSALVGDPNRESTAAIAGAGFAIGPLETFEPRPNSLIARPVIQGAATRPTTGRTR
jgi:hypothetical protein